MRIRRIKLVGIAAAMIGAATGSAQAEDATISTATTTPVSTSDPVAGGAVASGNVTVATGGSITLTTAGQSAITVDSNNNVNAGGTLTTTDADNTNGIHLLNGFAGTINNTGSMSLSESYTPTDTAPADGDLDGPLAMGANRNGILLDAGVFTGNITSSGNIIIEGNNSAGIRLNGLLDGDGTLTGNLNTSGNFQVTGDNSHAVIIAGGAAGGLAGDLIIRNAVNVRGLNSTGLTVDAPIDGQIRLNGAWSVSGFRSTIRPADPSHLDADDLLIGGPTVAVHFSVAEGLVVEGVGVEDDIDDDGDGVTEAAGDTDDDATATLRSYGSSPVVDIRADASANLVLGATASGYGFWNRGNLLAEGIFDNIDTTAVRIAGNGVRTVSTANGLANDFIISSTAREANSYGVFIGANANVPTLLNRGTIGSVSVTEGADNAYGVYIDNNANVPTLTNNGVLRTQVLGEIGAATTIFDDSNTLATINNTGAIAADVIATDSDLSDNVVPVATGPAVAINVANSTIGVTLNQTTPAVFTDDDTVDDNSVPLPTIGIRGDILFGTGADTVNLSAGFIQGDISFNNGADVFNINNGAEFHGQISDSDSALTINVIDGTLDLQGGSVGITSATIGADGILQATLSGNPLDPPVIAASGAVTFVAGAQVRPHVPVGLPTDDTQVFLTAGQMFGGSNVTGTISGEGVSYLYNLSVALTNPLAADGAANGLEATYAMKTAAQLGFGDNQSRAFDPIIAALRTDSNAAQAFAALDNAFDFNDAYEDLMPTFASGATELAATAIQQMQGATSNRLAATRLHELDDVSVWAQEIGYGLTRTPDNANGQEFRGHGFGLAAGIDGPLNSGGLFGISASFITSEVEEPGRPTGQISVTFGQANAYLGTALGPVDLDVIGGLGVGKMEEERVVEIGDTFSATTSADWWSYEGHGAIRASVPLRVSDWLVITPQTALTYVALQEDGYTESGGGTAIDYDVGNAFSQRLWADAGIELGARFNLRGGAVVAPRIFAGYRANVLDEGAERDFRVVSTGDEFTLTDEGLGTGGPLLGIGIDATNGYSTFSLSYEGEFGDQIERHSLNAAIRFRF